ncbi:hypothetical protein [Phaffia rhodozyma]|uniref:Uncharacterized protein n=1 Tax=Phaffia rhodozyma TaxID=264483 RepID=A0A0F7SMU9_PHARH|nr:hypothetical protein [Phaffia rhodozyma]
MQPRSLLTNRTAGVSVSISTVRLANAFTRSGCVQPMTTTLGRSFSIVPPKFVAKPTSSPTPTLSDTTDDASKPISSIQTEEYAVIEEDPETMRAKPVAVFDEEAARKNGQAGPWTGLDEYPVIVYQGPVAKAFKLLKAFSLSSLCVSTALSPFIFILDAPLGMAGRIFLAGCAISTTILSTAMIGWCSSPYVNTIELLEPKTEENPTPAIRLLTYNALLQARYTTITTPLFVHDSPRPLSTWALGPLKYAPNEPYPDIVAQTEDKNGKIIGRWDGEFEEGKINRVFMVHEDLLEGKWGMDNWRSRKGGESFH